MAERLQHNRREIPMKDGRRLVATYDSGGELRKTWIEGPIVSGAILDVGIPSNLSEGRKQV